MSQAAQRFYLTKGVHAQKLGNNKGTIPPEYPVKPCYQTEEKAKRANKIAYLDLSTKQEVGYRTHDPPYARDSNSLALAGTGNVTKYHRWEVP